MRKILLPVANVCRVLVGALFVVSGLIKINDALGFMYKLEVFRAGALNLEAWTPWAPSWACWRPSARSCSAWPCSSSIATADDGLDLGPHAVFTCSRGTRTTRSVGSKTIVRMASSGDSQPMV